MPPEPRGDNDGPETATLMAAVIRLMAQCANSSEEAHIRTLLSLLRQLRDHPDLPRQPAVLASLATAHAIWVERLSALSEAAALAGSRCAGGSPSVH
ncbi:MAG: hypothetical protein IT492_06815 [Gammaproteobacteria bacterium]|nr:hypothetical protein [Gammaproteobacteria bacterium]